MNLTSKKVRHKIKRNNDYKKAIRKHKLERSLYDIDESFSHKYFKKTFSCNCGMCRYSKYLTKIDIDKRQQKLFDQKYNDYLLDSY